MRAGQLRQRITVEQLAPEVRDPYGDPEPGETWVTYGRCWGFIEPLQGQEFFNAQQMQSAVDHRITLRYDDLTSAITPAMRIRYGAQSYDIQSVVNVDTRNHELQVMAKVRA